MKNKRNDVDHTPEDSDADGRLCISLAYKQLTVMPTSILERNVQYLDLSYNNFKSLAFLERFPRLETLVLDRNLHLDCTTFPQLKNLRILWLNNCNLINIDDWLCTLSSQCPNLSQLSMMCNPVGGTVLNGVSEVDEYEYRKHVASMLPFLSHFDGILLAGTTQAGSQWALLKPYTPSLWLKVGQEKFRNSYRCLRKKVQSVICDLNKASTRLSVKKRLADEDE